MGLLTIFSCALALCFSIQAQTVQSDWLFPSLPNLFQTIPIGLSVSLSWDSNLQSWFETYAPAATITDVDLWITDYNLHIFDHQIGTGIDVSHAGTFAWTCDVPSSELAVTNEWVFRFVANNQTASSNTGTISSPGFNITSDNSASTTISNTLTSAPTSLITTAIVPTNSAASTTSAQTGSTTSISPSPFATPEPSSSLSTGAKAGIAISAVAGACILVGVGWFLARRRQRRNQDSTGSEGRELSQRPPGYGGAQPADEKKHPSYNGPEIPSYRAELDPGPPGQRYDPHLAEMDGQSRATGPR